MTIQAYTIPQHLIPLFTTQQSYVYATSYATEIVRMLESGFFLPGQEITFSDIRAYLTSKTERESSTSIHDMHQVGEQVVMRKVDQVQDQFEFSIRGDSITAWLPGYTQPIRADFFGEELDTLQAIHPVTKKSEYALQGLYLFSYFAHNKSDATSITIPLNATHKTIPAIFVPQSLASIQKLHKGIQYSDTKLEAPSLYFGQIDAIEKDIARFTEQKYTILLRTNNAQLQKNYPQYHPAKQLPLSLQLDQRLQLQITQESLTQLPAGFIAQEQKIIFLTDRELHSSLEVQRTQQNTGASSRLRSVLRNFEGNIQREDIVVHEEYGIAKYRGLKQERVDGILRDYIHLEFADQAEIFVPIKDVGKVTKYLGNEATEPALSPLGKGQWKKVKQKVQKSTLRIAQALVKQYAQRTISKAVPVAKENSTQYESIVADFPYKETRDQDQAIREVINDLQQTTPMRRLLVGDVGFGKTEVIIRAAAKVVEAGGQVAFLSPTTVLTAQHADVLTERFKPHGISVKSISRFSTPKQNAKTLEQVADGTCQIVVGTHRLLSNDVKFKKLQLLVIDEEQKFGVKQKEKITALNTQAHVLSVSATPIPRSLNLALSSIQDISLITTPPTGRKPVNTEIIFQNWEKAAKAIAQEIQRGGQVYFVHNRVRTIQGIYNRLVRMLPDAQCIVAHGQMSSNELDRVITSFYKHEYDVLLATAIIENGLDIPNVNTIVIHNAQQFGLSQLYQLRGRVGRSDRQAFCYLMCPEPNTKNIDDAITKLDQSQLSQQDYFNTIESLKEQKKKQKAYLERLKALVQNQDLGAGFAIASKDLEIRGAGEILGEKQSGHIAHIGYALYIEMLTKEVERLMQGL